VWELWMGVVIVAFGGGLMVGVILERDRGGYRHEQKRHPESGDVV